MSDQLALLESPQLPAYARHSEPSKAAARRAARTGLTDTVRGDVLKLLSDGSAFTQKDLALLTGHSRASIASACNWLSGGKILANGSREHAALIRATPAKFDGCAIYVAEDRR